MYAIILFFTVSLHIFSNTEIVNIALAPTFHFEVILTNPLEHLSRNWDGAPQPLNGDLMCHMEGHFGLLVSLLCLFRSQALQVLGMSILFLDYG